MKSTRSASLSLKVSQVSQRFIHHVVIEIKCGARFRQLTTVESKCYEDVKNEGRSKEVDEKKAEKAAEAMRGIL